MIYCLFKLSGYMAPKEKLPSKETERRSGPAIATVKRDAPAVLESSFIIKETRQAIINEIARTFVDKGYDPLALQLLLESGGLHKLFSNLALRQDQDSMVAVDDALEEAIQILQAGKVLPSYTGSPEENVLIDEAIKTSTSKKDPRRQKSGVGATPFFRIGDVRREEQSPFLRDVKVVVIGGGAAGLMTTRGLIELGFQPGNIQVLDKNGKYGGIWNQANVADGSKNNPFPIDFEGIRAEAAPGPGFTIADFLQRVTVRNYFFTRAHLPIPTRASVIEVIPGDLHHIIRYKEGGKEKTIEANIIINAIGNSRPLPLNREGYIQMNMTKSEAGERWQQQISEDEARKFVEAGTTLVFIGLGNSTAEMLVQLKKLREQGIDVSYKVLTHIPNLALENPDRTIEIEGRSYRVFRDISRPNLTKWAGDLPEIREAYFDALNAGNIISSVKECAVLEDKTLEVATETNGQFSFENHKLFTLIGYGQDPDVLRGMGMQVIDEYLGVPAVDYDGEVQSTIDASGRDRVYPGYFAIGTLIKSESNPNATVIPGIQARMYDLLLTAVIRGTEVRLRKEQQENGDEIEESFNDENKQSYESRLEINYPVQLKGFFPFRREESFHGNFEPFFETNHSIYLDREPKLEYQDEPNALLSFHTGGRRYILNRQKEFQKIYDDRIHKIAPEDIELFREAVGTSSREIQQFFEEYWPYDKE